MKVVCVRHLPTVWNRQNRFQGRADISICKENLELEGTVKAARAELATYRFDMIYASPLLRTQQTAQVMGYGDKLAILEDLIEFDFGRWEG